MTYVSTPVLPAIEGGTSRRRLSTVGLWVAVGWLALMVLCAAVPFWIAPYDPLEQHLDQLLELPSAAHWLGTDEVGRDVLSRLIWGARPALIGVTISLGTALVVGVLWGLIAGYVRGIVETLLMRFADIVLSFPAIILCIALATTLGGSLAVTMFAVGFSLSPSVARLMLSGVVVVRQREFVEASRMYGFGIWHRMFRHVAPNAILPVLVQLTIFAGVSLLAQTGLAFLGVGIQPPEASWGSSLGESFAYINYDPWLTVFPGVIVVLTVLSFYELGDRLRDRVAVTSR